jgi:Holliday junction resolvase
MTENKELNQVVADVDSNVGSSTVSHRTDSDRLPVIPEEPDDRRKPDTSTIRGKPARDQENHYRWGNAAEHEARRILREQGWEVSWWSDPRDPPDLFAVRKNGFLLVMVRRSSAKLDTAHKVSTRFADDLERMRSFTPSPAIQKQCWVLGKRDGWVCWEILPGGLRRLEGKQAAAGKKTAARRETAHG